jgi:hypothetical protein
MTEPLADHGKVNSTVRLLVRDGRYALHRLLELSEISRPPAAMIRDHHIWRAALAMVKRYGAGQLLEDGDMAGAETWHRMILDAVERLQAKAPADAEKVH